MEKFYHFSTTCKTLKEIHLCLVQLMVRDLNFHKRFLYVFTKVAVPANFENLFN